MSFSLFDVRVLLLVGSGALLSGCPDKTPQENFCDANADDPGCFGEAPNGNPEQLTYRIVTTGGAKFDAKECGSFGHTIQWQMPSGSPAIGYIVQKVRVRQPAERAAPNPENIAMCGGGVEVDKVFWEAWRILPGEVTTEGMIVDAFGLVAQAINSGWRRIDAEASYYTRDEIQNSGLALFTSGDHYEPLSAAADSTTVEPDFWEGNAKPRVKRSLKWSWKCCGDDTSTTVDCDYWPGGAPGCN